jgi:hypothetical protein
MSPPCATSGAKPRAFDGRDLVVIHAVDPENRLVARRLETAWEKALHELADAEAELARREAARPKTLNDAERAAILALGDDLHQVWTAPTITDRDRKQLLRTLLDEVNITPDREAAHTVLLLRWKGGAVSELTVPIKRKGCGSVEGA